MGSSSAVSPEFSAAFLERAGGRDVLPFADFMDLALYHPELGYYCQDRRRVGYDRGTDFYTATSSGPLFGELVVAACVQLLGGESQAQGCTFVEIGAEPSGGVLTGVNHPFAAVRTLRVGEELSLDGRCVVFSNELFDAQPFRRLERREAGWMELGVALRDGVLIETDYAPANDDWLPDDVLIGYIVDASCAATALASRLAQQPWTGLFVAFDYGKDLVELLSASPAGTLRAYFRHKQSNALLDHPGDQDLTGHVCWDWLSGTLQENGFARPQVESQEAFFIHHAGPFLAAAMAAEASGISQRKLALMQLLHPSKMGQKFQVLHALR